MTTELLRKAATILRERAEAATPGEWTVVPGASNVWRFPDEGAPTLIVNGVGASAIQRRSSEARLSDAVYIATMHPGVGLALADWLDDEAGHAETAFVRQGNGRVVEWRSPHAVTLARLIVGEQS